MNKSILIIIPLFFSCASSQKEERYYGYSSNSYSTSSRSSSDGFKTRRASKASSSTSNSSSGSFQVGGDSYQSDLSKDLKNQRSHRDRSLVSTDPPINPPKGGDLDGVKEGIGIGLLWSAVAIVGSGIVGKSLTINELNGIALASYSAVDDDELDISNMISAYAREFVDVSRGSRGKFTGLNRLRDPIVKGSENIYQWSLVQDKIQGLNDEAYVCSGMFFKKVDPALKKLKSHAHRQMLEQYVQLFVDVGRNISNVPSDLTPCFDGTLIPIDDARVCFDWVLDHHQDHRWPYVSRLLLNPPNHLANALDQIFSRE